MANIKLLSITRCLCIIFTYRFVNIFKVLKRHLTLFSSIWYMPFLIVLIPLNNFLLKKPVFELYDFNLSTDFKAGFSLLYTFSKNISIHWSKNYNKNQWDQKTVKTNQRIAIAIKYYLHFSIYFSNNAYLKFEIIQVTITTDIRLPAWILKVY